MPEQGEAISFLMINRKLFNHWIWKEKRTFSKCEAWLDLIRQARFEQSEANELIGSKLIKWNRGQYPASIRFLGKRWGWGEHKVRDFLELLEKEKMIILDNTQGQNVITLLNYDQYNPTAKQIAQRRAQQNEPPQSVSDNSWHTEGTPGAQGGRKSNKENKENTEKKVQVVELFKNVRDDLPELVLWKEAGALLNVKPDFDPTKHMAFLNGWARKINLSDHEANHNGTAIDKRKNPNFWM